MTIQRFPGSAPGRSRIVVHNGLVYTVATAASDSEDIAEQTRLCLAYLDKHLHEARTNRSGLLQVTVYLSDISHKPVFDAVWRDWIGGPENWPQRACVGTQLAGTDLVEVVAVAMVVDWRVSQSVPKSDKNVRPRFPRTVGKRPKRSGQLLPRRD